MSGAPQFHPERADAFLGAADTARRTGVRLYPIVASGAGSFVEYLFRTAAFLTMARYIFLTNDSGIGNDHVEPHIPCYEVQHLDELLRRTILSELVGARLAAPDTEILRTVGDPDDDGVCTLEGGVEAHL